MDECSIPEVSIDELREAIKTGSSMVIDVMPGQFYLKRHIQGAVNACVHEVTFTDQVKMMTATKLKSIILYGAGPGSQDAVRAAEKLTNNGYREVAVFPGGIDEWIEAGLPLEGNSENEVITSYPTLKMQNRNYKVDTINSFITWRGSSPGGSHRGVLGFRDSEILHHDGMAGGHFIIDMKSIKNLDLEDESLRAVLESHLNSEDFFHTALFPEARFTLKKAVPLHNSWGMPNFHIQGTLSIMGIQKDIDFPAHVRNLERSRIGLQAFIEFDRTDWGVLYGSTKFFRFLGYHVVYDIVHIDITIIMI